MNLISGVESTLSEILQRNADMFDLNQSSHFEWLRSIDLQIQIFSPNVTVSRKIPQKKVSMIRFVSDESLLDSNEDPSDSEESLPRSHSVSALKRQLTLDATKFKERWKEMLLEKKASTLTLPITPPPPRRENIFAESTYEMSDEDEDYGAYGDEDMYLENPIEVHGKMVPDWARGKNLLKRLKRQTGINPEVIFTDMENEVDLEKIFGYSNSKWEQILFD